MHSIPDLFFALSGWLRANTGYPLAEWLSGTGGLVALLAGIVGGWLALKSYLSNSAAIAHAHMHLMFQKFLEARDDFWLERDTRPDPDFGGSALYFLEEVFAWTRAQKHFLERQTTRWLIGRSERARKADIINSWESTIISQLIANRDEIIPSMKGYPSCYGSKFLLFAAKHLGDPELISIASQHRDEIAAGRQRPLGALELEQRSEVAIKKPKPLAPVNP